MARELIPERGPVRGSQQQAAPDQVQALADARMQEQDSSQDVRDLFIRLLRLAWRYKMGCVSILALSAVEITLTVAGLPAPWALVSTICTARG